MLIELTINAYKSNNIQKVILCVRWRLSLKEAGWPTPLGLLFFYALRFKHCSLVKLVALFLVNFFIYFKFLLCTDGALEKHSKKHCFGLDAGFLGLFLLFFFCFTIWDFVWKLIGFSASQNWFCDCSKGKGGDNFNSLRSWKLEWIEVDCTSLVCTYYCISEAQLKCRCISGLDAWGPACLGQDWCVCVQIWPVLKEVGLQIFFAIIN